jgi:hypothetical protein
MIKKNKEEKMKETKNKKGSGKLIMMTSFLSGITGALVAYMTPKTGEVVREKILKMTESLKKSEKAKAFTSETMLRSGEVLNSLNQKVTKLLEHGIKLVDDSKELLTTAYLAGRETYEKGGESTLLEDKTQQESVEQEKAKSPDEPLIDFKEQQAEESEKEEINPQDEKPVAHKDESETPPQQKEDEKEKNSGD